MRAGQHGRVQRRDTLLAHRGHELCQLLLAGVGMDGQPCLEPVGVDEAADRQRAVGELERAEERSADEGVPGHADATLAPHPRW
jgi:hypothetical protein